MSTQDQNKTHKQNKKIDCSHFKSLIFLFGLSGAGRSTALDALSDLGFFVNDNLPVALCSSFIEHTRDSTQKFTRTALAPDVDTPEKVDLFLEFLKNIDHPNTNIKVIFVEAKSDVVVRRYGQTRRPHPCFDPNLDLSLEDTIEREKRRLSLIRDKANLVIDTSELNLHELRKELNSFVAFLGARSASLIRVNLISFGFKYGIPNDCDIVADVRFLPNPFFVPHLKEKSGLEKEVKDFVFAQPATGDFLKIYLENLEFLINKHVEAGKLYLNIGLGCTGGKHRSVVLAAEIAEQLANRLDKDRFTVSLRNRDILKAQ